MTKLIEKRYTIKQKVEEVNNKNMEIINVPIDQLKFAEYNPRQASEKEVKDLKNSLEEFGFAEPIVVNSAPERKNVIIGGHFRTKVAKELGWKEIPVVYINIPDIKKEQELNLRLNKNLGSWDLDMLTNIDEELLNKVGFTSEELDKIFNLDIGKDIDEVPEPPEEPKSKLGEIYQLGDHRLMCGDSTKKEDVERLMGGEKADMVFCDPPYGIDLDTDYSGIMNRGKKYNKVIGDAEKWDFNKANWFDIKEQFWWGADNYRKTLPEEGSWFVWDKQISDHDGRSHTGNLFELCWSKNKHRGEIIKVPYFRFYGMDTKERLHPTQKPVKLAEWFIEKFSKRGQNIIDLFGGSGSTLIACEQLNRKCFMMEIDPKYTDVIIERWEKFTGLKAQKLGE